MTLLRTILGVLLGVALFSSIASAQPSVEQETYEEFLREARGGDSYSQAMLGAMYQAGVYVDKDYAIAVDLFKRSAAQGDELGQFFLGLMYQEGTGVPRDSRAAADWYRKSAEQGFANAQQALAAMYANGSGVSKNFYEAAKWYKLAAEQGNDDAQQALGSLYFDGDGVPQDHAAAAQWFRLSAKQGNAFSQFWIGALYAEGMGVPMDPVEAYKWEYLAANAGQELAIRGVRFLEKRLSSRQIAEGRRLAMEFEPVKTPLPTERRKRKTVEPTTVKPEEEIIGTATGFFITTDGVLVTNDHVVRNGKSFKVLTDSGLLAASLIQRDVSNDLAILRVEGRSLPLPVSSSRNVRQGQGVATLGFPNIGLQGYSPKLSRGEIASLSGVQDDPRQFQISVPIQPGNSGGPLVDLQGNVVGVIVSKLSQEAALTTSGSLAENVNYAIKSSLLLAFLEAQPTIAARLSEPLAIALEFEEMVAKVSGSIGLVVVYR